MDSVKVIKTRLRAKIFQKIRSINHPEYTAKIKVIPKKDYPVLMPCEF